MIDLVGRSDVQRRVRAMMIVPIEEQLELLRHRLFFEWDDKESSALLLHGLDEPLENRDAAVLADCAESAGDSVDRDSIDRVHFDDLRYDDEIEAQAALFEE